MPFRGLNLLSAPKVKALSKPGKHADGGGLFLRIDKSGRKSWAFIFQRNGRAREASLGAVAGAAPVSLAMAREAAEIMRADLLKGLDPIDARRAKQEKGFGKKAQKRKVRPTFLEFAREYIRMREIEWRGPKSSHQWNMTILGATCARLHKLRVDKIEPAHVKAVLMPIWLEKPETARRVRQRILAILNSAFAEHGIVRVNPAQWEGLLQRIMPKQPKADPRHHAAMDWRDVPGFVAELRQRPAFAARALEFLILTASRTSEVLGMRWAEVNFDVQLWTVPKDRMKNDEEHQVPLPDRALAILREMERIKLDDVVFPGERGALSGMAFLMLLRRMGRENITAHGFRASFRVWAAEATTFPAEVAEAALSHKVGSKVQRAYQRSNLIEQRRQLMAEWAAHLEGGGK